MRALALTTLALTVALVLAAAVLRVLGADVETPEGTDWAVMGFVGAPAWGILGGLLATRRPEHAVGWIVLVVGLCHAVSLAAGEYGVLALLDDRSLPLGEWAYWLQTWTWVPGYALVPTLLLLLVPDGRPPSPRWRPLVPVTLVAVALGTLEWALAPYTAWGEPLLVPDLENPVELDGVAAVAGLAWLVVLACIAMSLVALVARVRRSSGIERQQLRWVGAGVATTLGLLLAGRLSGTEAAPYINALGFAVLPAAIAVAVLRHGLWDLGPVVRRSVVAVAMTLAVLAIYGLVVLLLGDALGETTGAPILATALVAVAVLPLHARLDRTVNRLLYGARDEPWTAVHHLGERLAGATAPGDELAEAAGTVARALRLPYAEVAVEDGGGGRHGVPGEEVVRMLLTYRGAPVGSLAVSPREPGRGLPRADRRALEALAPQLGAAAHAARLSTELRRSREHLVEAREEERRRLRRDLHDELGPSLAVLALRLDAARDHADSEEGERVLRELAAQARDGVAQVRRIVHDLRPPALDDLGLAGALGEHVRGLRDGGLDARLDVPEALGELPAATELAAFRIAHEALANAARHAGASACTLRMTRENGHLVVSIKDDGRGIDPAAVRGVGLDSMAGRAAELGGRLDIEAAHDGGTHVRALLPVDAR